MNNGWIKLTNRRDEQVFYIQVSQIVLITNNDDGCEILLTNDEQVTFEESPEEVMSLILGISVELVNKRHWGLPSAQDR